MVHTISRHIDAVCNVMHCIVGRSRNNVAGPRSEKLRLRQARFVNFVGDPKEAYTANGMDSGILGFVKAFFHIID